MRRSPGNPNPDCFLSDHGQYHSGNCEEWIIAYAGLIFLGFGATEWTRKCAIGYYKTMLAYGIKLMVTLLLAGIGLDILHNVQARQARGGEPI